MPVKLPAPLLGTEAQPEPKSPLVVVVPEEAGIEEAGIEEAGIEEAGEDADDEAGLELHAAAVRARQAPRPEMASRR
jgi:hypothetical protein